MRQNKFGRIINIASAHGLVGSPFKAAYVAAKHGIVGLTKVAALETAEEGITCNAICPGYVYTPLVEAQIDGQAKAHGISREKVIRDVLLAQQPNKHFATVEELGALTVFLAQRRGGVDHRHRAAGRWRLDRALKRERNETGPRANFQRAQVSRERDMNDVQDRSSNAEARSPNPSRARSCWCCRAAARSAPIRPASIRRCTRPASSRTGSSAPRSAPSMPA